MSFIGRPWGCLSVILFALAASQGANSSALYTPDNITEQIQQRALRYFTDNAHPLTGQVRDMAHNFVDDVPSNNMGSIAATGFGLAVVANAAKRGMVTYDFARAYAQKILAFAADHVPRRNGWFTHFYDWQSGERFSFSEYSTIDTALFMAGALYAGQVLKDRGVSTIVETLYKNLDFVDMMTDGGAKPEKRTVSMAYFDGFGYSPAQWDMYAEQMILLILGLGHPTHPLPPETWAKFSRNEHTGTGGISLMGLDQALFVHQYSQLYLDLRTFNDGFKNYFANSTAVSKYHRQLRQTDNSYKTLRAGFWGFSAGESPDGYRVADAITYGSTACIACSVGSAQFFGPDILGDFAAWVSGPYSNQIWGRYGLTDSIDLDQNWYSPDVLAITVGPEFLSLANLDDQTGGKDDAQNSAQNSIWYDFMQIPEIQKGLAIARQAHPETNLPVPHN